MGTFMPGQSKPPKSGRKLGTPNFKTQLLNDALLQHGVDLPKMIASTLAELEPEQRMAALLNLMNFVYPKRKSIEFELDLEISRSRRSDLSSLSDSEILERNRQLIKRIEKRIGDTT
jgi:hypothetical protein